MNQFSKTLTGLNIKQKELQKLLSENFGASVKLIPVEIVWQVNSEDEFDRLLNEALELGKITHKDVTEADKKVEWFLDNGINVAEHLFSKVTMQLVSTPVKNEINIIFAGENLEDKLQEQKQLPIVKEYVGYQITINNYHNPEKIEPVKALPDEELQKLQSELEKEKTARMQLLADFQNFRKRVEKEKADYMALANKALLNELLELVDDFNRAFSDADAQEQQKAKYDNLRVGVENIASKVQSFIVSQGLQELNLKPGDKFNPVTMEAITAIPVEAEAEDSTVKHIVQKGYTLQSNNEIYRMAKVIIAKYQK